MHKKSGKWVMKAFFIIAACSVVVALLVNTMAYLYKQQTRQGVIDTNMILQAAAAADEQYVDSNPEPYRTMHAIATMMRAYATAQDPAVALERFTMKTAVERAAAESDFVPAGTSIIEQRSAIRTSKFAEMIVKLETEKGVPLSRIVYDREEPTIAPAPEPHPFFNRPFWSFAYLCFAALFLPTLAVVRKQNPLAVVAGLQWSHAGTWAAALLTLPASAFYAVVLTLYAMLDWDFTRSVRAFRRALGVRWRSLADASVHAAYRLRLLRQMPAPVVSADAISGMAIGKVRGAEAIAPPAEVVQPKRWVVVPQESVLGKRHLLRENGIACYPLGINSPVKIAGMAFDERDFGKARDLLGMLAPDETQATDVSKTRYAFDGREVGKLTFTVRKECEEGVLNVLRAVSMQNGGMHLIFRDNGWESDATEHETDMVISICATVGPNTTFVSGEPRGVGVVPIEGVRGIRPGPKGFVVRDAQGVPVAQVAHRKIVLLFDFLALGATDQACETLVRVINDALNVHRTLCTLTEAERLSRENCSHGDIARQQFIDARLTELRQAEMQTLDEIDACDTALAAASRSLTAGTRTRKTLLDKLATFAERGASQERERLGAEYDRLTAMEQVAGVEVADDHICVTTDTLTVPHNHVLHRVGPFVVKMYFSGGIGISVYGTAERGGRDFMHPHVDNNGKPCLGNIAEPLAKLAARREYAAEFALILRFLGTSNPDDTRAPPITGWPVIDPADYAQRERPAKDFATEEHRTRYIEACVSRIAHAEVEMLEEIERIEAEAPRLQEEIVTATRARAAAQRRLQKLRDGRIDRNRELAARAFERLLALPAVASVNGLSDRVEVFTNALTLFDGEVDRYIGRLKIVLGDDGKVRVASAEDNPPSTHPHPNVSKAGHARFGTLTPDIERFVTEKESDKAAALICQFLSSWTPDDRWLTPLQSWPKAEKGKA